MYNLIQIQEEIKNLPLRDVMDYANGKNPQVPPYVALGELNRRRQLEETAKASQAQPQSTVKQQVESSLLQGSQFANNPTTPPQIANPTQAPQMGAPTQAMRGANPAAAPQQVNPTQAANPAMLNARPMANGGLATLPTSMFKQQNFAGGGIVAFDEGGDVNEQIYEDYLKGNPTPENLKLIEDYINSRSYESEPVVEEKPAPKRPVAQGKDYNKLDPEVARVLYEETMSSKKPQTDNLQLLADYVNREKEKPEEKPLTGKTGKAAAQKEVSSFFDKVFGGANTNPRVKGYYAKGEGEPGKVPTKEETIAMTTGEPSQKKDQPAPNNTTTAQGPTAGAPAASNAPTTSKNGLPSLAPARRQTTEGDVDKEIAIQKMINEKFGIAQDPNAPIRERLAAIEEQRKADREASGMRGLINSLGAIGASKATNLFQAMGEGAQAGAKFDEAERELRDRQDTAMADKQAALIREDEARKNNDAKGVRDAIKDQKKADLDWYNAQTHRISANKPTAIQEQINLYKTDPALFERLYGKKDPVSMYREDAIKTYLDPTKNLLLKKDYPTLDAYLKSLNLPPLSQAERAGGTLPKGWTVTENKS